MKFPLLVAFVFILFGVQAQTYIKGTLIDSLSGEPIMYSNVLIRNNTDSIIAGTMSDFKGDFKLKTIGKGEAILEISSVGYKTVRIPVILTNDLRTLKLGEIHVPIDEIILEGAEIVASKPYMVQKFDRKVFSISEGNKAASSTILDMLKTLPGVVVDAEGNVRYKGAVASIYVDDLPAEYVYPNIEMIPIDKIDKIELIDASMRTGGSGKGGIINIRMKGATSDGLSGVFSSRVATESFKRADRYNGFLNLNYKSDKLLFFNNLYRNSSFDFSKTRYIGDVTYNSSVYHFNEEEFQEFSNFGLLDHIGVIYTPSLKTKLTVASGFNRWCNNSTYNLSHIQNVNSSETTDEYSYETDYSNINFFSGTFIQLHHTYDTTQRELSSYIYLLPNEFAHEYNNISDYYYVKQNSIDINEHYTNSENAVFRRHAIIAGLYYNHPINEKTRWNLEYSGNYTWVLKQDLTYMVNGVKDYNLSMDNNGFMQNDALSVRIGTMQNNWKLDGGITTKYDYFNFNALRHNNSSDESDTTILVKNTYTSLLPSATLGYVLNKVSEFKLTYALTVKHPDFGSVINFLNKTDPIVWSNGNPDLESVKYHNVYFGYSYNKQVWNASLDAFYSMTNNDIQTLKYPVSEIIFIKMPYNVGYKQNIGVEFSTFVSIKKIVNINLSGSVFHSEYNISQLEQELINLGYTIPDIQAENYGSEIKLYANILLGAKSSLMIWMNYKTKEITFNGYSNRYIGAYTSFTRKFLKNNNLILNFGVNNFLGKINKLGGYRNISGFEQTTDNYDATSIRPIFFVSLKYNFRQGDRNTGKINVGN